MRVKAFSGVVWTEVEAEYNTWAEGVEILSLSSRIDQETGALKIFVVYRPVEAPKVAVQAPMVH
jgi:hypothetical protein